MSEIYICDAIRTPIGRFGGSLAAMRPDDLAAHLLTSLTSRHPAIDWAALDEVLLGCTNQAGEDSRNVARMALLLSGLPVTIPAATINRLCGSGLDAVGSAARAIKAGEASMIIAGGVESMSRAPYVFAKSARPFDRTLELHDSTIGWRFINPRMQLLWGVDSMPETAENIADDFNIARADQDQFALASQRKTAAAQAEGWFTREIIPVSVPSGKKREIIERDEHPRADVTLEGLARLPGIVRDGGSVTAGNASGVNDGACALLLCSAQIQARFGLTPLARVLGMATAGVEPRIMGIGPVPASQKLLARLGLKLGDFDLIELNEAFAAQALAVLRQLGLDDDDPRVNPKGGAIALGHPLGMSGARLAATAAYQLQASGGRLALLTMCIGVGQGIAMVIERV